MTTNNNDDWPAYQYCPGCATKYLAGALNYFEPLVFEGDDKPSHFYGGLCETCAVTHGVLVA